MNRIHLYQYENQSLDTSYLYFLEDSYLADIVKNMESMEADAVSAKQAAGSRFEDELTGISGSLGECKENYRSIRELSSERRYTPHAGNYGKLLEQDEKLREGFAAVADDHSWVDGTWVTQPACGGRSRRDKRGGSNFGIVCADTAES